MASEIKYVAIMSQSPRPGEATDWHLFLFSSSGGYVGVDLNRHYGSLVEGLHLRTVVLENFIDVGLIARQDVWVRIRRGKYAVGMSPYFSPAAEVMEKSVMCWITGMNSVTLYMGGKDFPSRKLTPVSGKRLIVCENSHDSLTSFYYPNEFNRTVCSTKKPSEDEYGV